jgi:hypothetical protein
MSADVLAKLGEILVVLKEIRDGRGPAKRSTAAKPATNGAPALGGEVASDEDLDGKYGDPEIRKDPPRWDGDSYAGHRMSQCSPEFLDAFAAFSDWKADRPRDGDDPKWQRYARKDATLARGWAARIRGGSKSGKPKPAEPEQTSYDTNDEIPF